ncbi:unnamed protein product [Fraxinus pennsylvanica]|uniref:Uncharacterized protein n=1 Tax=Fraxinus pennsylvanica TaxID=56036 RepID=A0AAD1YU10_9LAMI|nr:unnamed protein product [Fraxinus pennsylvanica]
MAQISIAKSFLLAYAFVVLSAAAVTVSAQAPAPSPDVGDAFSLPVSGAVIGTSLLQLSNKPMAQISIAKSFLLAYAFVVLSAAAVTVSAQAPAPSPDIGDAFSLPVSGAVIGTSLLFSLFALLRH